MSESFILSLVFIAIIALLGVIGAGFGVARGLAATASILGGAELGLWWGDRVGGQLSDWFGVSEQTGRFLASMLILLTTLLLLGVGASLVLSWGMPTRWGATLGILLGAANGALLIAMALRLYFLSYDGTVASATLDDSIVTRVLWGNYDWFILGFLVIAALLLLYTRFAHLAVAIPDPVARAPSLRPIPPPVPRPEQPVQRMDARPSSWSAVTEVHSDNGSAASPGADPIDDALFAPPHQPAPVFAERTSTPETQKTRVELPSARNTVRFCPNCGMTLDASDRFCPDCGLTL